ncbi:MAG TPA: sporulation integral membrane protein YtvI, partial [Eubacteriaceae bacterium]|nr:sporulation integral membrane protein YtvI [Eubacteriaceae bacterium]
FLVPWAIFSFITGNISLGISLLVIYGITLVVRQIVEPKIVGKQIGIHPLLTLASMYIGLRTIGVTGIILGPFIFITLKIIFSVVFNGESIKELFLIEVDAEQADQE